MSNTYSLICRDLKLKLWIGQQSGPPESHTSFHLYMDDGSYYESLRQFFQATLFHPIEVIIDGCDDDAIYFEEFKEKNPPPIKAGEKSRRSD